MGLIAKVRGVTNKYKILIGEREVKILVWKHMH
jgi:hypothetical protein